MKTVFPPWSKPAVLCLILAVSSAGCGLTTMDSVWRDREITIDGIDAGAEWENARHYFEDKKITLGMMNDDAFLYLRLSSRDRAMQSRMMMSGLTIWINAKGNKDKKLGIHYPVSRGGFPRGASQRPEDRGPGERNQGNPQAMLQEALLNIALTPSGSKEESAMTIVDAEKIGILARIAVGNGNMVYEVRVPLTPIGNSPYSISPDAKGTIGIGFETGKLTQGQPSRNGGRGGGMGGIGGRGGDIGGMGRRGGGTGRGSGRGGGMRPMGMEPLELWLKVHTAAKPNA